MLKPKTVKAIASAGHSGWIGAAVKMSLIPLSTRVPHEGVWGDRPNPRKLREVSVMIAAPMVRLIRIIYKANS
jgi:hypothetical protein